MKELIAISLLTAVMLLTGGFVGPAQAQSPSQDLKPTFISQTPGLFVNGWPAFTVSYPKEWEQVPNPAPGPVFSAGLPRPDLRPGTHIPLLTIDVMTSFLSLEEWAKMWIPSFLEFGTDLKVLSDKPSQLQDGTPAREVEFEYVDKASGHKVNDFILMMKNELTWVAIHLFNNQGRTGEDLKRIAYSLTFQPDREKPVQVPADVRAFLDMYCVDLMSHDVKTIMEHFSDRLLHSGGGKAAVEQYFRNDPTSPIHTDVISEEATVTVFEPRGDKAYIDGFYLEKIKGDANSRKMPMRSEQIINEHGEWKWYGNRK
jgi:hypothetical protein